ncbi:hypothetical protein BH10PLA2_BH10PLA2_07160 [soil metagenome]
MTSVQFLRAGAKTFSLFAICASSSVAVAQQQRPNFNSPSPFGYTGRLSSAGFENQGFQNAGFQNVGFRNAGFQNVGFRNSSISNTGMQNGFNGGTRMAAYPNMGRQNYGNYVPFTQMAPNVPSVPSSNPVVQQGVALDSTTMANQSQYTPLDDTATISVGRSTNLTTGYRLPAISRGARFTVGIGFDSPVGSVGSTNPQLGQELQTQFSNSQFFPAGKHITVTVDNNVVVLQGRVTDEHEKELAEAVVRLSPGVYQVRNELLTGEITASNK